MVVAASAGAQASAGSDGAGAGAASIDERRQFVVVDVEAATSVLFYWVQAQVTSFAAKSKMSSIPLVLECRASDRPGMSDKDRADKAKRTQAVFLVCSILSFIRITAHINTQNIHVQKIALLDDFFSKWSVFILDRFMFTFDKTCCFIVYGIYNPQRLQGVVHWYV